MKTRTIQWKAVINGRRALNGERYSATFDGDAEDPGGDATIYTVLYELAEHLEEANQDMAIPDSLQVTIFLPNK